MKLALAIVFAFSLGAVTRWLGLPVPAPPKVSGVLLILAVTLGYLATDRYLGRDDAGEGHSEARASGEPG